MVGDQLDEPLRKAGLARSCGAGNQNVLLRFHGQSEERLPITGRAPREQRRIDLLVKPFGTHLTEKTGPIEIVEVHRDTGCFAYRDRDEALLDCGWNDDLRSFTAWKDR
jgi:hypothetical protein